MRCTGWMRQTIKGGERKTTDAESCRAVKSVSQSERVFVSVAVL
jgi:hypothetical protein